MVRVSVHIVVIFFLTALLAGCEPQARHQVLTFFFTGVPPLDETGSVAEVKEPPPTTPTPAKILEKPALQIQKPLFSHPVWGAGTCNPCHESSGTFSTPGITRTPATVFKTGGGMPGKLTLPKNELCIQCHKDKSPKRSLRGEWRFIY